MFYLIGQIALTIFFTAMIGITMGWLLRGLGASRQNEAIEARWRARIAQLEQRGGATGTKISRAASDPDSDTGAAGQIAALQKQVKQRDELLASMRAPKSPGGQPDSDNRDLATRFRKTTELCTDLQQQLEKRKDAGDQLEARLEQARIERETLIERLRDRESEIGRMSQERQHAINTIASLQKEMRRMRGAQYSDARTAPAATPASDTNNASVRAQPAEQSQSPAVTGTPTPNPAVSTQPPTPPGEHNANARPVPPVPEPARQQNLPIADDRDSNVKPRYEPTWRLSSPNGAKDNLQAILGIGPKLEARLNRLGIFHFEQIGRFQREDILWVAHHLKSFPGRIVRDRWIEQAQTLANQRHD